MTSVDSSKAIGAVTKLIHEKLGTALSGGVDLGFPRDGPGDRAYLILYEIIFDPSLKNISLDEGQPAPVWLVLKYLLTAYSSDNSSYTAYENIGLAIRTLQSLNFIDPTVLNLSPLKDNPEPLKVTFDEAPLDTISKILGTVNEKYQCSLCFQIRPIMITLEAIPSYSLLIGVDYAAGEIIGDEGIAPLVEILNIPNIDEIRHIEIRNGERIEIKDARIEFNTEEKTAIIIGSNLDAPNLYIKLSDEDYPINNSIHSTRLEFIINVTGVSAGSYPISVIQKITDNGEESARVKCASNVNFIHFLPRLDDTVTITDGKIELTGTLLGSKKDAVFIAFYQEGEIIEVYSNFEDNDFSPDQTTLKIKNPSILNQSGTYRVILRVNSQQAKQSPEVVIP